MSKKARTAKRTPPLPEWQQFETAVARFAQAIAPDAKVLHNVKLPDKHTKRPRQRDVWIEAQIGNHYPIRILVSCKKYRRKVNQQHVDAFIGEVISAGAHKGVLYSASGFTTGAIEKANAEGICCCRLYQNQPADLPPTLTLYRYYCLRSTCRLNVANFAEWHVTTWGDVFQLTDQSPDNKTLLDVLVEENAIGEAAEVARFKGPPASPPQDWTRQFQLQNSDEGRRPLIITILGTWFIYRGKMEAVLLNGSYSFTSNQFVGSHMSPAIDMQGATPGPDWEKVDGRPADLEQSMIFTFFQGNVRQALLDHLADKPIVTI